MCTRAAQSLVGLVAAVALAAGTAGAQSAPATPRAPLLQLRMASETPQPGFERRDQLMGGIPAYVSPGEILSDSMIRDISVTRVDDVLLLNVHFSEEGRRRLEAATRERMSSHLAVLFDSHLVTFSVIQSTLSLGHAVIGLKLPPDRVEYYRAKIAEAWPDKPGPVSSPQ